MRTHLAARKAPRIVISDERGELLGTGGGVLKVLTEFGGAPFFHVNADTIWIDGATAEFHAARGRIRSRDDGRAAAARSHNRQHRL